jgi:hypothetical protein
MKVVTLVLGLVLIGGLSGTVAHAQDAEPLRMQDAGWIRDAGDRFARCAGIYRGAAAIMRDGGRAAGADYAESVASGALFASYLLLSSPEAVAAAVLHGVDPSVHIEALVWGTKRNFIGMEMEGPEQARLLRECTTRTSALQSAVLRSSWDAPAAATTAGRPKS